MNGAAFLTFITTSVYKYATSFCAALVFARRIRAGQDTPPISTCCALAAARPLDAVATAGVNLRDPAVFREAFDEFATVLQQLETALPAAP